jgi:hypothetical protein
LRFTDSSYLIARHLKAFMEDQKIQLKEGREPMRELNTNMRRDLEYQKTLLRFGNPKNNIQGNDESHMMLITESCLEMMRLCL